MSTTPVFERLKRLEKEGFIKKYIAVLDAEKLGRGFTVFCSVKLKQMSRDVAVWGWTDKGRTVTIRPSWTRAKYTAAPDSAVSTGSRSKARRK